MVKSTPHLIAMLALAFATPCLAQTGLASPSAPDPAAPVGYTLGAHDVIEVTVLGLPELTTKTRIDEQGMAVLPLVGAVELRGLSPEQAADAIARSYVARGFTRNPAVRVEILDFQSRKASVLGQVNAQGIIPLDHPYTLVELIARAGGLAPDAAESVVLIRAAPDGSSERRTIQLDDLAEPRRTAIAIQAGDIIFVPKAPTYSVVGAVNRAGTYKVAAGMTVQQALAAAGDVARIGSTRGLRVRRAGKDGTVAVIRVALDDPIAAGDVIMVRERLF